MRKAWPFTVNVLLFASGACHLPFFVLYYQSLGFTGTQIRLLTSLTPLVTLVGAPLCTNVADATQRHHRLMTVAILGAAVGGFMGGPLMESLGGRGPFRVYGVVILLIVAAVVLLQKRVGTEQNRPLPGNI